MSPIAAWNSITASPSVDSTGTIPGKFTPSSAITSTIKEGSRVPEPWDRVKAVMLVPQMLSPQPIKRETLQAASLQGVLWQTFQFRQQFPVVWRPVQRIDLGKYDLAAFVHDKYCSLADSGEWRAFPHNAECLRYLGMGIKIRTHGEMHGAYLMLLPGEMAVNRVCAYVQDLGIERGELLAIRVERRQLLSSSRRPIQGMESYQHMSLP